MAGFFQRLLGWLLRRPAEPPSGSLPPAAMGIPAPHTLVARVGTVAPDDERGMVKLAEESLRRGFPHQAAIAYEKAARRFAAEGKHHKRIAVLQQLAKVNRDDPKPFLELVEVNELIDRKRDADLARLAAAEIYRRAGRDDEASRLERQVAPRSLSRAASLMAAPVDPEDDGVAEMPGDSVLLGDADPSDGVPLPPVMPVDLVPNPIDADGPIDLSLDGLDGLDSLEEIDVLDDEEGFDSIVEAPAIQPLAIDDLPTDSDGDLSAQTIAYEAVDSRDLAAPTRSYEAIAIPSDSRTLAITPLAGLEPEEDDEGDADVGAQTIAMPNVHAMEAEFGAQTIAMSSVHLEVHDEPETDDAYDPDVGAATVAMSAIDMREHTSEPPRPARRSNIADAATQMDPRGVPGAVVGTKDEAKARASSRMNIPDDDTRAYDPDLARALKSKIGR